MSTASLTNLVYHRFTMDTDPEDPVALDKPWKCTKKKKEKP